ncbi:QueT transporter family protein [Paucilactobacillus nenjiangensis]|jgi:uncharacterized membrane protein|uniref:QueT transporter family protein n=1 Tax=Paucilactobacillus nenjiangensis TaxID=1296540 RepID=UPI0010F70946|nr:QueT transporter family protein [Paucilactobacillus nenjiangensis]
MEKAQSKSTEIAKIGIVAALYVAVTMCIAPLSYGAVQLRLAEGFNHLTVFNKRYIAALTVGCAIANITSPLGIVDVIFGALGTLVMTSISYWIAKHIQNPIYKMTVSTVVCTIFSWSVALELNIVSHLPFWPTYLTVASGELISLLVGMVIFTALSRRIDLSK